MLKVGGSEKVNTSSNNVPDLSGILGETNLIGRIGERNTDRYLAVICGEEL